MLHNSRGMATDEVSTYISRIGDFSSIPSHPGVMMNSKCSFAPSILSEISAMYEPNSALQLYTPPGAG